MTLSDPSHPQGSQIWSIRPLTAKSRLVKVIAFEMEDEIHIEVARRWKGTVKILRFNSYIIFSLLVAGEGLNFIITFLVLPSLPMMIRNVNFTVSNILP